MDGAGPWQSFRHVTLPIISPVLFYNLIIALIAAFQYFTQAYVLGNGRGDPARATLFYNLNLYHEGFALLPHGLRLGAGVGPVHHRPGPDGRALPNVKLLGL